MRLGYGRLEFRRDGIVGYRLMGCWSPFAAVFGDWWIDVAGKVLLLNWFLRLLALVELQPGERARFPCGEILADTADGLSVPVVRSGNTGKSRFLEASLAVAVPIPFPDSGRTVPIGGELFLFRSNGARSRLAGPTLNEPARGAERVGAWLRQPARTLARVLRRASVRRLARRHGRAGNSAAWGCWPTWSRSVRSTSGKGRAAWNGIGVQLICRFEWYQDGLGHPHSDRRTARSTG